MDSQDNAEQLLLRAKQLMAEVLVFAEHFKTVAGTYSADGSHVAVTALNYLKQQLKSEIQGLEGVVGRVKSSDNWAHAVSSTNLPYFESLWAFAKQCKDVVALRKWVYGGQDQGKILLGPGTHVVPVQGDSPPARTTTTLVDIIADGGLVWIKISTITSKRLLWDLTKLGWAVGLDDDDSQGEEDSLSEEDFEEVPLFKLASALATSAGAHRVRGRCPRVKLVLTRLSQGESRDVDTILTEISKLGIEVVCSSQLERAPTLTPAVMHKMAPSPFSVFSEALNMDTSVLIALISDCSHFSVDLQPWFSATLLGHIANEKKKKILPTWLYPAMDNHKLVCTRAAADTCRSIVSTIGTPTELARLELLLPLEPGQLTREEILNRFSALSDHTVPDELQLPVWMLEDEVTHPELSPEAWQALERVSEPTRSVFAYGWITKQTTLTSNGVGINNMTRDLEDLSYDGSWPSVWLCPFSRSLVGTPKSEDNT